MSSRIFSAWVIGILAIALIASLGVGIWIFARRATIHPTTAVQPSLESKDGRLIWGGSLRGKPGPIPELKKAVDEKIQRARALHLVTLKVKGTRSDLRTEIQKQTGIELRPGEVDMSRLVDLDVTEWPIRRVLDHLNLDVDPVWTLSLCDPGDPPLGAKYLEGISFAFSASSWESEGKRLGWIVKTDARQDPNFGRTSSGWIKDSLTTTWDLAAVHSKEPVSFETCSVHSPGLVYVPRPDPGTLTVKIRGTRYWYLDVPIEFRDPKPTDTWKGRGFEISLASWPVVTVKSRSALPERLLSHCLRKSGLACYFKNGQYIRSDDKGTDFRGLDGGRWHEDPFDEKITYAWCGCPNGPREFDPERVVTADTLEVSLVGDDLSEFKSIQIDFRALIREDFEVTSDPLPTK